MPRHGRQDKCSKHRLLYDNALSDCSEEERINIQALSLEEHEKLFEERQRQGCGPPGRGSRGKSRKKFDYTRFVTEKKTSTYTDGMVRLRSLGHWGIKQHMMAKKNWTDKMAETHFWKIVADKRALPHQGRRRGRALPMRHR